MSLAPRSALLCVLLFAALLRGGVLWVMRDNLNEDRDAYREIAENLATYRVFGLGKDGQPRPTAYRPPLYPVMLAKLAGEGLEVTPLRVAMLHWLLGMGTVGLTWVVAGQMARFEGGGVQSGVSATRSSSRHTLLCVVTSLLVACDPILLHWSTFVMTETLATFLAILALYTLARFHFDRRPLNAAFAGCALGLAVLCRPTFLPWVAVCGLGLLFLQASGGRQPPNASAATETWPIQFLRRAANLVACSLIAVIVVSPWGYRNYQQLGRPIITTTHGGYTFYLANNGDFYAYLHNGTATPWDSSSFDSIWSGEEVLDRARVDLQRQGIMIGKLNTAHFELPANEISEDSLAYRQAQRCIQENPVFFSYSCLYRITQLWSPLPHKLTADESGSRALLRYATCAWYLVVFAAAIAGIWRLKGKLLRSPWIWGVLLCLVFTGVHAFYWSNMRMRAPLMPVVAMAAAVGVSTLMGRLRK